MAIRHTLSMLILGLTTIGAAVQADPIILESFSGYPDNALISDSPSGPATGLTGDWMLDPPNYFYINRTEADPEAGTGKAVYDMPYDDNGARTAQREAVPKQALFEADGDVVYASFRIRPPRDDGHMLFTLELERLDGGGQPGMMFGMMDRHFVIGNGGVNMDVYGGIPAIGDMQVVLRVEYGDGGSGPDDLEVVTLWVDPGDESSSAVIDSATLDFLHRGGARISGVSIRGDQMDGQPAFFDDLRVGFEFSDVVQALPQPEELSNDIGMNGLFFDPNNSGHGFNFVMHGTGLTVFYYGHTSNGERLWLHSEAFEGDLAFGMPFELDLFELGSGSFGYPQPPVTSWGTVVIDLADCDTGHASLNGMDGVMEMDFIRLTSMPGISCQ